MVIQFHEDNHQEERQAMKLITIEGDVFRADRIAAIDCYEDEINVYLDGAMDDPWVNSFNTEEDARAAQLRAVADWKKALE
jgi:hypothetical protein